MKKAYIIPQTTEQLILKEDILQNSINVVNEETEGLEGDAREESSNLFGTDIW